MANFFGVLKLKHFNNLIVLKIFFLYKKLTIFKAFRLFQMGYLKGFAVLNWEETNNGFVTLDSENSLISGKDRIAIRLILDFSMGLYFQLTHLLKTEKDFFCTFSGIWSFFFGIRFVTKLFPFPLSRPAVKTKSRLGHKTC